MLFLFIKEVIEKNIFWVSHKYCQGQGWNIKLRFFLPGFEVLKTKKIRVFPRFFAMQRETLLFSSQHLFSLLVTNISYLIFLPLFVPSTLPPFSVTFLQEKIGLVTSKPACWGWKGSEAISLLWAACSLGNAFFRVEDVTTHLQKIQSWAISKHLVADLCLSWLGKWGAIRWRQLPALWLPENGGGALRAAHCWLLEIVDNKPCRAANQQMFCLIEVHCGYSL